MLRERTLVNWLGLALMSGVTLGLSARTSAPPPPPPPEYVCVEGPYEKLMDDLAAVRAETDALYRARDFDGAAQRIAGAAHIPDLAPLAQQYAQYAAVRAIAFDPAAPPIAAFEALRAARTLDMVLGDAFGDELTLRMRELGPVAARAYWAAGDRAGARLAEHTSEMAGTPAYRADGDPLDR